MNTSVGHIVFDSKTGWGFGNLLFRPENGTTAELLLDGDEGIKLFVQLRGVRSPESLLAVLRGFDDFHILRRETGTPFSEFARFICRFFVDDDTYETVIDEWEAHKIKPEQAGGCDGEKSGS